jgi:lipid-binding SYLF domain-containing protein
MLPIDESSYITMKKLFCIGALVSVLIGTAGAASEQEIVDRSARIIGEFRSIPEKQIPRAILRRARGLAVMSVVKAGFIFSGKAGHGIVIARINGNHWSGPSFVGTGGAGWGLQAGAQLTDFVFVLNNRAAVRAFSRGGNVTLGADVSAAAGPVGRDLQAGIAPTAAVYTYSRSKGLFAGVSLEGAVIATRKGANARYYGRPVDTADIVSGRVVPPRGANRLRSALVRSTSSGG